MQAVHVTPYGGTWYPDCRAELDELIEELFETSQQRTGSYLLRNAAGFVVPHAGLQYSGAVAAAAYRHLRAEQPRRVIIIGFAHKGGPPGISIPDIQSYETPLGETSVDREAIGQLLAQAPFRLIDEDLVCDHSVEIQLPLLQKAAPAAKVIPLFVGHLNAAARDRSAAILAEFAQPGTIFVVSSDLTHYGRAFGYQPFPVDSAISARLCRLDQSVIEHAASLDADMFLDAMGSTHATLCGRSPIALWLRIMSRLDGDEIFQETLDYQTSGEITGDYEHSVSYGALGYFPVSSFWLDADCQDLLRESANRTLSHLRATGEHRPIPPRQMRPALARKPGVFVSLHQGPRLLGCVGNRAGNESLAETVPEMTLRAALDDPRFPTVLGVEGQIDIEISILSPMKPIRDERAFQLGIRGATLDCCGRQSLLLPQVAASHNWNAGQFLTALSMKAGLGSKGYQGRDAHLSVFQAQILNTV